jgi:hypothetical protein
MLKPFTFSSSHDLGRAEEQQRCENVTRMYRVAACKRSREELGIFYILQEPERMVVLHIADLIWERKERFIRVEAYGDSTRDLTEVETYGGFHALQESGRKVTLRMVVEIENEF